MGPCSPSFSSPSPSLRWCSAAISPPGAECFPSFEAARLEDYDDDVDGNDEDGEGDVDELINDAIEELDMADVIGALNDVFYVVRVSDEARFVAQQNSANPLLGKLTSRN